jgi:Peroxidase
VDLVTLVTGSYTLGGVFCDDFPALCPSTSASFVPFDDTPRVFDNHVFVNAVAVKCVVPFDCRLAADLVFDVFTKQFAYDQEAFFK